MFLDPKRNIACSGSRDKTVRVWDLNTGTERFKFTGHTSRVGQFELSGSHLVSASNNSILRVWDLDTGEMKHTRAVGTGTILSFQYDESKVLSGYMGGLEMWDLTDGSVVRDLLTEGGRVWRVTFEGRWCVAATDQRHSSVVHVWDFGTEVIENEDGTRELRDASDRITDPSNGVSDDTTDDEYEEDDAVTTDMDSLGTAPSSRDSSEGMDSDEEPSSESPTG